MKVLIQILLVVVVLTLVAGNAAAQATSTERAVDELIERLLDINARTEQLSDDELRAYESQALVFEPFAITYVEYVATSPTTAVSTGKSTEYSYRIWQNGERVDVLTFAEITSPEEEYSQLRRQRRAGRIVRNVLGIASLGAIALGTAMAVQEADVEERDVPRFVTGLSLLSVGGLAAPSFALSSVVARAKWETPAVFFSDLDAGLRVAEHNERILNEMGAPAAPSAPPVAPGDVVLMTPFEASGLVGRSGPVLLRAN